MGTPPAARSVRLRGNFSAQLGVHVFAGLDLFGRRTRLLDDDVNSPVHRPAFSRLVVRYRAVLTQPCDDQLLGIEAVLVYELVDDSGRPRRGELPVVSVAGSWQQGAIVCVALDANLDVFVFGQTRGEGRDHLGTFTLQVSFCRAEEAGREETDNDILPSLFDGHVFSEGLVFGDLFQLLGDLIGLAFFLFDVFSGLDAAFFGDDKGALRRARRARIAADSAA